MDKLIELFQLEKSHLRFLFIIALLILLSVNIVSYMNAKDLQEIEKYTSYTVNNVRIFEDMRDKITAAQTGRQLFYISNDKSFLTPYANISVTIDTLYSMLRILTSDNQTIQGSLDTLSMYTKMRFEIMNHGIELQERKGNNDITVKKMMTEGKDLNDRIMEIITSGQDEEYRSLNNKIEITNSKSAFAKYLFIGGSSISIFILIFTFIAASKVYKDGGIRASTEKLTQDELETIVRDRTAEISQINNRLYKVITKHEEAEVILRKKEQDYRILFEQAHDAIMIFDAKTAKVLDVNKRACFIYQIPKEKFIGLSLKALVKNLPDSESRIKKTIENGFCNDFQTVHYKKDGTEMLMEINGSFISYRGTPAILSINRDITDRILNSVPISAG